MTYEASSSLPLRKQLWDAKRNGTTRFMFDSRVVRRETSSPLRKATNKMQNEMEL